MVRAITAKLALQIKQEEDFTRLRMLLVLAPSQAQALTKTSQKSICPRWQPVGSHKGDARSATGREGGEDEGTEGWQGPWEPWHTARWSNKSRIRERRRGPHQPGNRWDREQERAACIASKVQRFPACQDKAELQITSVSSCPEGTTEEAAKELVRAEAVCKGAGTRCRLGLRRSQSSGCPTQHPF